MSVEATLFDVYRDIEVVVGNDTVSSEVEAGNVVLARRRNDGVLYCRFHDTLEQKTYVWSGDPMEVDEDTNMDVEIETRWVLEGVE